MHAEGNDLAVFGFQHLAIRGENEVIIHAATDFGVPALGGDEEIRCAFGPESEMEIHRQSGGVKCRPEISRSGW